MIDKLLYIRETVEGYEVKNLTFKPLDNIIVGLVRCPYANPKLYDGYVCFQWRPNGSPTYRNRDRTDLALKIK